MLLGSKSIWDGQTNEQPLHTHLTVGRFSAMAVLICSLPKEKEPCKNYRNTSFEMKREKGSGPLSPRRPVPAFGIRYRSQSMRSCSLGTKICFDRPPDACSKAVADGRVSFPKPPAGIVASRAQKILALSVEFSCKALRLPLCAARPNSHVPVAVCRSVGIRTRGRTVA
jgi:hypothetical protein